MKMLESGVGGYMLIKVGYGSKFGGEIWG